jgi:hypothetical protein
VRFQLSAQGLQPAEREGGQLTKLFQLLEAPAGVVDGKLAVLLPGVGPVPQVTAAALDLEVGQVAAPGQEALEGAFQPGEEGQAWCRSMSK